MDGTLCNHEGLCSILTVYYNISIRAKWSVTWRSNLRKLKSDPKLSSTGLDSLALTNQSRLLA